MYKANSRPILRRRENLKPQREFLWFDFPQSKSSCLSQRMYVVSIYTSCGRLANSFFPWHRADPFKNVAHWVRSASPVTAITYCRSQGDSLLVYCSWTTRLQHDERTIAKCLLFAMSWLGTRCKVWCMTKWLASRLEASTFLQSGEYNDNERFFMAVDRYRR